MGSEWKIAVKELEQTTEVAPEFLTMSPVHRTLIRRNPGICFFYQYCGPPAYGAQLFGYKHPYDYKVKNATHNLWEKTKTITVTKSDFEWFVDLWTTSDQGMKDISSQIKGLLFASPATSIYGIPSPEPIRAWRIESLILNRLQRVMLAIKGGRALGLKTADLNKHIEAEMGIFWRIPTLDLKGVGMKDTQQLLLRGPGSISTPVDWFDVVERHINHFIPLLTTPIFDIESEGFAQLRANCQLGALYIFLLKSVWAPILDNRVCRECGASIAALDARAKYCSEHQKPKYQQRRARKKREISTDQ